MSLTVTPVAPCVRSARRNPIGLNEKNFLLFGAVVLLLGAVFWTDRGPNVEKTDFSVTYIGASLVHQGNGARLYDLRTQANLKARLFTRAEPLIYEHPPFEALLLSPLAALPYKTAYLIWGFINVAIWLALPLLLRPYAPVPRDELGYFVLWFLFAPLGVALYQGQSSLVLLLLYALTFVSLKNGRDARAGLLLGLGLFKFQFVLPFALIFLLRRKWNFLAGFALSGLGLGLLSLAAVGWQGMVNYVHLLLNVAGHPDNVSYGNPVGMATVQGFIYAILGGRAGGRAISMVVAAASALLIAIAARRWPRENSAGSEAAFDLKFAVAVAFSLVTGFHMFAHDLSPLMLAMFLVAAHIPTHGRPALRAALWTTLVLLWIPPLHFLLLAWHRVYLLFPVLMAFAFAALQLASSLAPSIQPSIQEDPLQAQ
jgi:hypothetical protein